ncbi:biopolymer transporter ExbD [Phormidium sp. CLA17]|uniref:ExbD/TolR family protein n=1 Tax=Leptolyngbya sp. Cla-17 TaxID=2803751 RepID=UPI001490D0A1|nr:biopolymer transporter ExbD [Leptolyngbya sp. Cla-17]MBM0740090.1 biopolymer transporter ExbD [Leptolyngbya sp. Cla-17]
MKIHTDAPSEDVQIQIIPLIDVIFCILTFFILAALQFTRQQGINTSLPEVTTGAPLTSNREMVTVTIAPTGQLYADQKPVDRAQLAQLLTLYVQQNPSGLLVLNASPTAFYNDVIQVLDLMRSVGGDRATLATTPAAAPSPGSLPTNPSAVPSPTASPFNPFEPFGTSPVPGANPIPGQVPDALVTPIAPNGIVTPSPTPSP